MSNLAARLAELSPKKRELLLRELKKRKPEETPRPGVRPRERSGDPSPLSYAQQRLWFLDQLEPGNPFYNLPGAIRLTGPLDEPALGRSLAEVVRRHEVLRTTFSNLSDLPVQRIGSPSDLPLPIVDVSALPARDRAEAARALVSAAVRRPFDLARGPVMRALLLRLGTGERILVFALHHIAADGWSLRLLVREVTALYAAFAAGAPSPLPDLPVQYADYAAAEQEWLSGPVLAPQLAYWKRRLGGLPSPLDLPGDRPRPEVQTFRGARHPLGLPAETVAGLKELGRREGATLFMTLLTALMVLLHRYSGREDLAIGTPIANRDRVETEGLIGFFVNTLVLRGELAGNPSCRELLARVRETTLGAFAHPDLPFERLVEELQPERDLRHSPLFQVLFAFQSLPEETRGDADLRGRALPVDSGASLFDLTLSLEETPRRLAGMIEYNTDLFDRSRMARMAGHFRVLLEGLASGPDQRLSELPLLTEPERRQLRVEWNATGRALPPASVHERIGIAAASRPEAVAVVHGGGWLSYGELDRRANRLARRLRRLGVRPEVLVGVAVERSLEMVVGVLAVLVAGGAYLPLDPSYPPERLGLMLADSGAPVLLTESSWMERFPSYGGEVVVLGKGNSVPAGESAAAPQTGVGTANLAYVIYTSGSTGRPKGVQISHGALANFLSSMEKRPGLGEEGVLVAVTSLSFDIAGLELYLPLVRGARLVVASREEAGDGRRLGELLAATGATAMQATPATWRLLRDAGWDGSAGLSVLCGGEALEPSLAARLRERAKSLWNLYGPTETTVWSTLSEIVDGEPLSIGRPIANTEAYLFDRLGAPVPVGVPGELLLGGLGLARGYLGRPAQTAERFVPHPFGEPGARLYRTGDLARYRPDGVLDCLGRLDQQVKVRGFRIELGEIEAALAGHPAVAVAAVLAPEVSPGGRRLTAYVVGRGSGLTGGRWREDLRAFLRRSLPEHMMPTGWVRLPEMPLTPNGKVDRRALAGLDPELAAAPVAGRVLPRTLAEELLAGIWQRVLRRERTAVAIDDNFFDSGGQSLMATQMMSQVRDVFGVELPLRTLFEAPTVAGLAARIEAARAAGAGLAAPPLVRVARDRRLPLSFGQQRLWFLHQLEPASAAYNMPSAVRLTGALDVSALAWSLGEVVRRHEVLRTVFRLAGEEPTQVVLPAGEVPAVLPSIDLAALPPGRWEREVRRLATAEARRPFDLAAGPLLRARLLRLAGSGEEHALLLCLHHIVADAWSTEVLVRELAALYEAASQGLPSPLPALRMQYADYAAWQRGWLAGEVLTAQIAYWRRSLAGAPPLLDLPLDRTRPAMQTFGGGRRTLALSGEVLDAVRGRCRAEGLTPFMALLAVFEVLLGRCSQQEIVVVGTPIANRGRAELEKLIGFFVNTLALHGDLTGDPTTRALLAGVRETALGAYAHQDLPFEKLVEELEPERNLAHSPLFQVLFTFENAPPPVVVSPSALTLRPLEMDAAATKFDLTLSVGERPHGLATALEYNCDLFDPATVDRLLGSFASLLSALVASPEARISELPLLTGAGRAQLLVEWNDTAPVPSASSAPGCLHELFEAATDREPEARAVVSLAGALTRGELDLRANRLAHHLRRLGVGPEVPVGICLERSLGMVTALLAVQKAGGAYLPLDPAYPRERLALMLADSGAPIVLSEERLLGRLPDAFPAVSLDRDAAVIAACPGTRPASLALPGNLAYLIYTSGSTGRPKGVAIEHRSAAAMVRWAEGIFPARERAGVLASTSICFDLSIFELFLPLCSDGTVILADNALQLPHLPAAAAVTLINTVPSAIAELVRGDGLPASVRTVNLAGEPLPGVLVEEIYAMGGVERVWNLYGPSEDTTYSTFSTIPRRGPGPPAIGRPVAGSQAYLLDTGQQPAPLGVPGELYLGGDGLARGYLGRPELTAERFVPDPFSGERGARLYRTGDLSRHRPDGELLFLGRLDHQVKVRGFRIELGEIEATLRFHPAVAEAVVLARGAREAQRLVAYVVARGEEEAPLSSEGLRSFLRAKLPAHMVPWAFVPLAALPRNANGKLDRAALPDPEREAWSAAAVMEEPRSEAERKIAAIWQELLGLDRVSIHDNFFDSGGHSLLAIRVYHRLKAAFGRELPLVALFEHPTIGALARFLERGEETPVSRQRGQERGAKRREAARRRSRTEHEPQEP